MEYLRESCTKQEGKCDNCRSIEWQGPVMERIPCPFQGKLRVGHYLDGFSTLKTNDDGSQEIDDFLPRAQVKKLFAKGELHSSDKATLAELSKELCVAVNLLEDSVKL